MDRESAFAEYINKNNGVNLVVDNINPIYNNLAIADKQNKLVEFLLNEKPYQSRFAFVGNMQARGCDQCALICALNIYGSQNSGFARRINQAFFIAARKSTEQAQALNLILNWQMHLQAAEASLINFADRSLITYMNNKIKKKKASMLVLWISLVVVGAIGAPGCAMLGLAPLALVPAGLLMFSLFKTIVWGFAPVKKNDDISKYARKISDNPV